MNAQLFFNTNLLLSGQSSPVTGSAIVTARSNELTYTTFASGVSGSLTVTLSYPSPFFLNEDVPFYSYTITGDGYQNVLYMTTPIPAVKASVNGVGQVWLSVTQSNI